VDLSRRDLASVLSLLAARRAAGETGTLPSKVYHGAQIPFAGDAKKKGRRFFEGATHTGFRLEVHETILGPGIETHPPHQHEHEEIFIVVEGTLETSFEDKSELAEPGSVVYVASNQMHSARNAGSSPCRYYVIELRGREA
jgi:mannose-6-phosphate isomerase-like protein (cupin superfamily)